MLRRQGAKRGLIQQPDRRQQVHLRLCRVTTPSNGAMIRVYPISVLIFPTWAAGPAEQLAVGLKAALDTQKSQPARGETPRH